MRDNGTLFSKEEYELLKVNYPLPEGEGVVHNLIKTKIKMNYEEERKIQLQHEIDWIKNKLLSVKKEKHRKDLERQIKERELSISIGIFSKQNKGNISTISK